MDTLPNSGSVTHVGKLYCHLCLEVQQVDNRKYIDEEDPEKQATAKAAKEADEETKRANAEARVKYDAASAKARANR
jgi:hypothetical protein